jgi:hypothetical protein
MKATRNIMQNVWQRCDKIESHLRKLYAKNRKRFTFIKAFMSLINESEITDIEVGINTVLPIGLTRSKMQ